MPASPGATRTPTLPHSDSDKTTSGVRKTEDNTTAASQSKATQGHLISTTTRATEARQRTERSPGGRGNGVSGGEGVTATALVIPFKHNRRSTGCPFLWFSSKLEEQRKERDTEQSSDRSGFTPLEGNTAVQHRAEALHSSSAELHHCSLPKSRGLRSTLRREPAQGCDHPSLQGATSTTPRNSCRESTERKVNGSKPNGVISKCSILRCLTLPRRQLLVDRARLEHGFSF